MNRWVEICRRSHPQGEGCDKVHLSSEDFDRVCRWTRPFWAYSPDLGRYVRCVKSRFDPALHGEGKSGKVWTGLARAEDIEIVREGDVRNYWEGRAKL